MEQRLFDIESLEAELRHTVRKQLEREAEFAEMLDGLCNKCQSDRCLSVGMLYDELVEAISRQIVEQVVKYSDYDTDSLLSLLTNVTVGPVGNQDASFRHGASKANALPSWFQQVGKPELTNCVITAWPTFANTLTLSARAAVKDTCKSLTAEMATMIVGLVASGGNPVAVAIAALVSKYIATTVAETMASLATVAFSLEKVKPSLRCVYQRAIRISRNNHNAVLGEQAQVTLQEVVNTFTKSDSGEYSFCSDYYHDKVGDCPFYFCTDNGDGSQMASCMLIDVERRASEWQDDEPVEEKIRRMMHALMEDGILTNRMERHPDRFFRSRKLVTSMDAIERL